MNLGYQHKPGNIQKQKQNDRNKNSNSQESNNRKRLQLLRVHPKENPNQIQPNAPSSFWGEFLGGLWIPRRPGKKLYGASEIRSVVGSRSILFIGDSLSRRLTATLFGVLEIAKERSDVSLDSSSERFWENPELLGSGGHYEYTFRVPPANLNFKWAPLLSELLSELQLIQAGHYPKITDIVIALGVHDAMEKGFNVNTMKVLVTKVFEILAKIAKARKIRIIWRTSPFRWRVEENDNKFVNNNLLVLNNYVRQQKGVYDNVVIVDFAREIAVKSIGKQRFVGDSGEHFNVNARMVCLEMLVRTWDNWEEVKSLQKNKGVSEGFLKQEANMLKKLEENNGDPPLSTIVQSILKSLG
eukprot:g274.t1